MSFGGGQTCILDGDAYWWHLTNIFCLCICMLVQSVSVFSLAVFLWALMPEITWIMMMMNMIERSLYGGDTALCQITLTTCSGHWHQTACMLLMVAVRQGNQSFCEATQLTKFYLYSGCLNTVICMFVCITALVVSLQFIVCAPMFKFSPVYLCSSDQVQSTLSCCITN